MPPALINHKYLNMLKINGQQALYLKKSCLLLLTMTSPISYQIKILLN